MKLQRLKVADLSGDPANARKHDERNIGAIVASLKRFGQQKPIVVDSSRVVRAGNGTLEAARLLGWTEIDCVVTDLKGSEATAYAIADNRTAELASWDDDVLAATLNGLLADDADLLAAAGFDEAELAELLDGLDELGGGEVQEDEVPEPPVDPITKPGDLWLLGDHRLLCGDSTKAEDVERLMAGKRINVAFTSPPYASQRKYDESSGFKPIHPDNFVDWFCAIQENVQKFIEQDGSWFVNIKEHCEEGQRSLYVKDLAIAHVRLWGWYLIDELCWKRNSIPGLFPGRFKNLWEPVFHFSRSTGTGVKCDQFAVAEAGSGFQYEPGLVKRLKSTGSEENGAELKARGVVLPGNVLEFNSDSSKEQTGHTAPFPVKLPSFFIRAYSDKGDNVYEPFCGSGTTLIAAEQLGRKCYGMEISPAYCDVIVKRWETLTGKKARLETHHAQAPASDRK